ncbi:YT521-B-like domain-containing protein [Exophiala viscosa]|uniref:YT521-B-like domain-containing protein n=1 Tax=Exophiala viscosa TaxID=2486360 RepID=A0AAN6DMA5_9EURO|nr:YT521-B-like domain-containing protein [Exophiala viscosa]KAI1621068.1 YT521-B-like domain-containing protein [Exophiala viscosa]
MEGLFPITIPAGRRNSGERPRGQSRNWGAYALWVGNIPQHTTVMGLRDYFSRAAPRELLTISYNPDSKYAFVNFSTESARVSAIGRAASQLFDGKRLDCRVRQETNARSTKVSYGLGHSAKTRLSPSPDRSKDMYHKLEELNQQPEADRSQWGKDKYFIIKSFSMQALYQSLSTNLWYIPKRHVERLNHAYQTARDVYFLFSVNGSGEFFGYATMASEIRGSDDAASHSPTLDLSDPTTVALTPHERDVTPQSRSRAFSSTSSATSLGSIHYEPERRRIIWEANHHSSELGDDLSPQDWSPVTPFDSPGRKHDSPIESRNNEYFSLLQPTTTIAPLRTLSNSRNANTPGAEVENISSPCQIRWLSTQNVPFDELRGLKNAWNENKEIYIARNVTAVDPSAGKNLMRHWKSKDEAKRLLASTGAILRAWPGS